MNEKQYRHIMYLNNKILCVVCSKQVEGKGYTFTYNGSGWYLEDTAVTLSQYGISVTGTKFE